VVIDNIGPAGVSSQFADIRLGPGNVNFRPSGTGVTVSTQISELLSAMPSLNPNALYSIWIGANDLQQNLQAVAAGQITSAQAAANIGLAAVQTAEQAGRLSAAGARYIIVVNLPDLGRTPGGQANGPAGAAAASQLTGLFNTTLSGALTQTGLPVIRANVFGLFNEILANPQAFGFANTTGVACTTPNALTCTTSTLVSPAAATTYVFADPIHPTPAAHAIIAQAVESMIIGPQQMAALPRAALAVEQANFRALDNRMWSSLNAPRGTGKFQGWAAYDYSSGDLQTSTNGSAHMNTVTVGLDMKLSDKMLAGAMFGYTDNKGDFGGPGGGYTLKQPVGTVYGGYGDGPWYVGVTLGAGNLDYSDISRVIPLGAALRTENAEARGYEYTGRILGGYWFTARDLMHGPYAQLQYTKAVVKQFSEQSSDSLALNYDRQEREALLWSVGWQVSGNLGAIRPYARATWEYDSKNQSSCVGASSVTLGGNYHVPIAKTDNSYALFNLGASTELGAVTGFIAGSATAGRTDGNYWAVTVGIRAPL